MGLSNSPNFTNSIYIELHFPCVNSPEPRMSLSGLGKSYSVLFVLPARSNDLALATYITTYKA